MAKEIVFNDPTSDKAWVVTFDDQGNPTRQDPPGQIPPNAYATTKGGGEINLLGTTYGQMTDPDFDMSTVSAGSEVDGSVGEYTPGADPAEDMAYIAQTGGTLMRIRYLLPLVGLLALTACKDEKKAETPPPPPPPAGTAPANPAPPATTTNPAPANKP